MPNNSLIIPCYNEEKNLINQFDQLLTLPSKINGELILVNNGSIDSTRKILNKLSKKNPQIRIVNIKKNIGYGHGIVCGLKIAKGKYIGWTHADGQTDHEETTKGFKLLEQNPYPNNLFVMGKRGKRKLSEKIFELGMSIFESVLFKTVLYDIPAQPKIMSKAFFNTWKNPPDDFSLDLYAYVIAKKKKLSIKKFNIRYKQRILGISSWNFGLISKIKLSIKTIFYSFKLYLSIKNEVKK